MTLETTDGGRRRHDQNGSAVGSVDKIAACNFEHRRRRHDDGCSPSQARRTGKRVLCSEGDLRRWPDDLQMSKADARSLVSGSTDRRWGWHDGGCSSTQGRLGRTGKRALGITGDLGCRPDHILVTKADACPLTRGRIDRRRRRNGLWCSER